RFKEPTVFAAPLSKLGDLTRAAGDDVLVALPTALRVIRRPKSVLNVFNFLEDETVIVKRAERYHSILIQGLERRTLLGETVGRVVKAGGRFGRIAPGVADSGAIFIFDHAVMTESISASLTVRLRGRG